MLREKQRKSDGQEGNTDHLQDALKLRKKKIKRQMSRGFPIENNNVKT